MKGKELDKNSESRTSYLVQKLKCLWYGGITSYIGIVEDASDCFSSREPAMKDSM